MKNFMRVICAGLTFHALLAGCSGTPEVQPESSASGTADSPGPKNLVTAPPASDVTADSPSAVTYTNIDRYKEALARHIVLHNRDHTFTGPIQPMLPAIVVLRMSVDKTGRLSDLFVHRSIDDVASRIALEAVERSQALPLPENLLSENEKELTFSETFLFNHDYRFQVRSIAPLQLSFE